MDIKLVDNKSYQIFSAKSIFSRECPYVVADDMMNRLAKDLGFSYPIYANLFNYDRAVADEVFDSLVGEKYVTLLIDAQDNNHVLGYTLDDRLPILNSEFNKRVSSLAETCDEIEIAEQYYYRNDLTSYVILKKETAISIEEKFLTGPSKIHYYEIGVAIFNDELNNAYGRLVLYVGGQPLYLPASLYNTSISRYKKSTANSVEALEVMVLKIIDDLREYALQEKLYSLHFRYQHNRDIAATYEEYNTVLKCLRKVPTIIEDNSVLELLRSSQEDFESKYSHMEDQHSSYIWRCTALGDMTVGDLVETAANILTNLNAPASEYFAVRDLLGTYISTNRIAGEIAKEDIR